MLPPETITTTDLILLGGGHSHLFVLERLAMNTPPGVRVTLVTRDVHTAYSGMLPGYIAGHYSREQTHIDLRPLAQMAGARIVHAEVTAIDADAKRIAIAGRPPLAYDLLSINIGSRPTSPRLIADERQFAIKPVDRFIRSWRQVERRLAGESTRLRLGIIGGGAGGVELALALHYRAQRLTPGGGKLELFIATDRDCLLPSHNFRVQQAFKRVLAARGIDVVYHFFAQDFDGNNLLSQAGASEPADAAIWVTQASPAPWLRDSGLKLDNQGFIAVSPALQSLSHADVFAAGDIATVIDYPRPKSGVFAVRQGLPLARNLLRVLRGRSPQPFKPQKQFLSLISTGDQYAVLSRGVWALKGRWCWRLKDYIDRKFMRRFTELKPLAAASPEIEKLSPMRCGGCGAKLGSGILEQVLKQITHEFDLEATGGFEHAEDAALITLPAGKKLLQTVDQFRSFIDDPYLFGKIAANHALGDLFAMGVAPHSALVMASVGFASEDKQRQDLYHLMRGVVETLQQHDTRLLGGHSGEASQMSCGLSVNGFAADRELWLKSALRPGQTLILTRELGSGLLFAADMRAQAQGHWIDAALEQMLFSNSAAADCLRAFKIGACTDVTGFGLAGHLFEMTRASGCAAEISIDELPLYAGVDHLVRRGIESSLQPQNRRIRHVISAAEATVKHPHYPLLFDPQTAGGLLFSVANDEAADCVQALRSRGYRAARIIGRVVESFDAALTLRVLSA